MSFPRFYPIVDTELLKSRGLGVVEAAGALLEAGVRIVQLRHKCSYTRKLFDQAAVVARMCREAGAAFIVNDRADVALLLDAGLHVGQDDLAAADARRLIGPARTLGLSTHNEAQFRVALAAPADYLAFGPVYSTASKRNPDPVTGPEQVARMRALSGRPLIAIGGIARDCARVVLAAGADSLAVIGDLYPDPLDAASFERRAKEWLSLTQG